MKARQTIGRRYMAANGALMLCLGLATCLLAAFMASPAFARIGYSIAIAFLATALVLAGIRLGAIAYGERSQVPIANYILAGILLVSCWLTVFTLRSAPQDLRLLSLLAGLHGALWSLWYIRLAIHLKTFSTKAVLLCVLAATTSFLGIVLSTQAQPLQLSAVAAVSYYSMFVGIQILLAATYAYRELEVVEAEICQPSNVGRQTAVVQETIRSIASPAGALAEMQETPIEATIN